MGLINFARIFLKRKKIICHFFQIMSSITIATTEKNKPLLIHNGFNYTIDRSTDTKTYWKCEYCRTIKCKGRIHTDVNFTSVLHETGVHNHPANAANSEVRLFQDKIRSRAINTNESTQNVIDNCLRNVTDQMVARLPNFKYIKRNIQRQRQQNDLPKLPLDKNFNIIPTTLTTTFKNEKFLQFDSGPGDNRLLIFASINQLKILEGTEEILIDGTFKVCISFYF
jgi:hypothetical protein